MQEKLVFESSSVLAVVQARMSSSRLPGKVAMPILGKPMILRLIQRLQYSREITKVIVATSNDSTDDELVELLEANSIEFRRGSLSNVFSRYFAIANEFKPQFIVRITGDCPLIDPLVVDRVVDLARQTGADYASNCHPRKFPRGLDAEVFKLDAIDTLSKLALTDEELEHVTIAFTKNPGIFRLANLGARKDLSQHRWTVDTKADFEFASWIYENLYCPDDIFTSSQIYQLLTRFPGRIHYESPTC